MTLQPAYETILRHGDHAVTLRASLRAAVALDNLPGGIPGAWDSLMRQTYTRIRAVILATATDRAAAFVLLAALSDKPLASFLSRAQAACLELLVNLLPEPEEPAPASTTAKPMPLRDYLSELFKFGTTILEWPPSEVWQASPAEIDAILRARLDRLEAMEAAANGDPHKPAMSAEQRQANEAAGLDPEFNRHALRALKARHGA
ncbi:phage tail assembly chaperone [Paracoccus versutus]|uniref:Tail assembly chaperone n=1 Tax=Paracoccus versutus TaxID=34007 RepID=A0A3D9XIE8_PARVE|nr:phage tail assembly chaperone [Paracoccus versutus]REF70266.1 tail assembly chaperone [Paracoccus versutus]WGR57414.1 phage tail assembly chaperone [Paracoccus versutus]